MKTICGTECCRECALKGTACRGCRETDGHPCGGTCIAAECIKKSGFEAFSALKKSIIGEVNSLGVEELAVSELFLLNGAYVNLEYALPNGEPAKLLRDDRVYLGSQVEKKNGRCFGVVADTDFLLVSEYGANGSEPKLILYKSRA